MSSESLRVYQVAMKKERLLADIVLWLKTKKLWEECLKDTGWNIEA